MAGIDKPRGHAVAVIVLLVVASAALRGYLPGGALPHPEHKPSDGASSVVVVALLGMSLAFLAVAVVARWRSRRTLGAGTAGRPEWFRSRRRRPTWRVVLIALAAVVVYLALVWLLQRLVGQLGVDHTAPTPSPSTATPPNRTAAQRQPPPLASAGSGMLKYLYASTVLFVLLIAAGAIIGLRAQRRGAPPGPPVTDDADHQGPIPQIRAETLARVAEVGLAEAGDLSREPREAIIACYTAMERELANVPSVAPQDPDTPTEVLARAVEHRTLRADSATELVDLFEEARFSPHVMTEGQRDMAVSVLRLVLDELRSTA